MFFAFIGNTQYPIVNRTNAVIRRIYYVCDRKYYLKRIGIPVRSRAFPELKSICVKRIVVYRLLFFLGGKEKTTIVITENG